MNKIHEILIWLYFFKSFKSFKKYGKNIHLSFDGIFIRPEEISFGDNIFINKNFHISARNLNFGSNIMIGPNLVIECDNHKFNISGKKMWDIRESREIGAVSIEDDVWIGANVTILPNVIIREGTVIGAGSVVTKTLPPYSVCVGVPCRVIKRRFNEQQLNHHLNEVLSKYHFKDVLNYWD
jgi:acetyltransferase-like isoleucine patch superfamily enzyme